MFTFIGSLQHASTVAVAVAGGQRAALLDRLSYDTLLGYAKAEKPS